MKAVWNKVLRKIISITLILFRREKSRWKGELVSVVTKWAELSATAAPQNTAGYRPHSPLPVLPGHVLPSSYHSSWFHTSSWVSCPRLPVCEVCPQCSWISVPSWCSDCIWGRKLLGYQGLSDYLSPATCKSLFWLMIVILVTLLFGPIC